MSNRIEWAETSGLSVHVVSPGIIEQDGIENVTEAIVLDNGGSLYVIEDDLAAFAGRLLAELGRSGWTLDTILDHYKRNTNPNQLV